MAAVNLSNNRLTTFESAVFLRMLEQMNLPFAEGYINLESSILPYPFPFLLHLRYSIHFV